MKFTLTLLLMAAMSANAGEMNLSYGKTKSLGEEVYMLSSKYGKRFYIEPVIGAFEAMRQGELKQVKFGGAALGWRVKKKKAAASISLGRIQLGRATDRLSTKGQFLITSEIARRDKGNIFAVGWKHISNGAGIKVARELFGARKPNKGEDWFYVMVGTEF